MKLLFILLLHPAHVVKSRKGVSLPLLYLFIVGYLFVCGISFQYLYPRLLNNVPWLGALRRLNLVNWNPAFDFNYFLRGAGMGGTLLLSYIIIYWIIGKISRSKGLDLPVATLAAMATCIPLLMTCCLAFGFYYLHDALGLVPAYGIATSACLHVLILRDLYKVRRLFAVYLAPLVCCAQAYACYLLLP